ncbi:unnamed protein product [Prorocentrum cordatum]|uniref:Uncharacterized protein n=1 Tax=Prorocentrum cordatum TaxID=2364126 RepID=A0ABN9WY75_9DINO|nr:unnamed protein product [Polarella glacialis]
MKTSCVAGGARDTFRDPRSSLGARPGRKPHPGRPRWCARGLSWSPGRCRGAARGQLAGAAPLSSARLALCAAGGPLPGGKEEEEEEEEEHPKSSIQPPGHGTPAVSFFRPRAALPRCSAPPSLPRALL